MSYIVYCIKCNVNNKVYIGQTKNINNRIKDHMYRLQKNIHDNPYLQEDYNRYGKYNFTVSVLDEYETRKQIIDREDYWINYYGGIESTQNYNCKDNSNNNSLMIEKLKHTAATSSTYGNKGKQLSEETKRKISNANKGKVRTKETKQKLREAAKHKLNIPWNKGMKGVYIPSEETKRKISESNKGKKFTDEHRASLSKAKKGKPSHIKYTPQLAFELQKQYNEKTTLDNDIQLFKSLANQYNLKYFVCKNLILYDKAYPSKEDKLRCNDYPIKEYNSSELEAKSNLNN